MKGSLLCMCPAAAAIPRLCLDKPDLGRPYLIQNEHFWLSYERSGQRYALPLAA